VFRVRLAFVGQLVLKELLDLKERPVSKVIQDYRERLVFRVPRVLLAFKEQLVPKVSKEKMEVLVFKV